MTLHGRGGSSLTLSPADTLVASMMDGISTIEDITKAVSTRLSRVVPIHDVVRLVEQLSGAGMLEEGLQGPGGELPPVRSALHAGVVYPADALGCERFFDGLIQEGSAGDSDERSVVGVISPHIDYARGRDVYARLWGRIARDHSEIDRVVIFGTSHRGGDTAFVLTDQDFETPLGPIQVDHDVIQSIDPDGLLRSQAWLHSKEHSIELQLPFIQRIWPSATMVPILCGRLQLAPATDRLPRDIPGVDGGINAIAEALDQAEGTTVLLAGADLAHVGRHFGDDQPLDSERLAAVEAADRTLLGRAAELDGMGVWEHLALELDSRRVCGFGPIWSVLALMHGGEGEIVAYDQAVDWNADLAVSYAGMVFRR